MTSSDYSKDIFVPNENVDTFEENNTIDFRRQDFVDRLQRKSTIRRSSEPAVKQYRRSSSDDTEPLLPPDEPRGGPPDRLQLVYIVFYILGIGTLLPWNFFSTAKQYFLFKLRNTSLPIENATNPRFLTDTQAAFESYLAVAAMVPNLFFLFLNTALTKKVRLKVRMITSLLMMIVLFVGTIVLIKIDTDDWQNAFLGVTLVTVVLMNANGAVMQGCLFGLASMFPRRYVQAVMGGQALGGALAAMANIISLAGGQSDITGSAMGYFLTATLILTICLIAYLSLNASHFAKFHAEKCRCYRCINVDFDSLTINDGEPSPWVEKNPSPLPVIFKKIWRYAISVWLLFTVTLSLYPGIISLVVSVNYGKNAWSTIYFSPVVCFLLFNVGDLIGRTLTAWLHVFRKGPGIPLVTALRYGFIPLMLLCNILPRSHWPVVFSHDAYPIVFCLVFAISNGFIGTLCMMYAPGRVHPDDAETAGSMMSFFISLGLATGSGLSIAFLKLI